MLRPIKVECYAGGRSDERPRRVTVDGREYIVARLLSESLEESMILATRRRRVKLITEEGLVMEVRREADGNWYLETEPSR